jgi:hypothetical protein
MTKHILLMLEPLCHLSKLILVIGCGICIFCKINVEVLGGCSVKIVSGAIESDEHHIVLCKV